jgi:hypothetical protein
MIIAGDFMKMLRLRHMARPFRLEINTHPSFFSTRTYFGARRAHCIYNGYGKSNSDGCRYSRVVNCTISQTSETNGALLHLAVPLKLWLVLAKDTRAARTDAKGRSRIFVLFALAADKLRYNVSTARQLRERILWMDF